jgi:hypothetical protein
MTGAEVIEEIKKLPMDERGKVLKFTQDLAHGQQLTTEELMVIARQMVETEDSTEADKLQEKFIPGFYGWDADA